MAPHAKVAVEDVVAVIKKHIDHFTERSNFPISSHIIWKTMSKELKNKWTPYNVYVNVSNNRRKVLAIACDELGIPFPEEVKNVSLHKSTFEDSVTDPFNEVFELHEESADLDEFKVRVTAAEWMSIQGDEKTYNDGRTHTTLRSGTWTDELFEIIQRQTNLPCCFHFDKHKISRSGKATHYLIVTGHCASKQCNNPLYCYLDEEPEEGDFFMTIRTQNTLSTKHEDVKRQLRGERRKKVGEEAFYKGCRNYMKVQMKEKTKFGGRVPPQIPKLDTIRQAKKEFSNDLYGIEPEKKNVVENLVMMRYDSKYHGCIHQVVEDKFFVSFSTPQQLHAYNQYCKISRNYSSISVDGTGSLVHKVECYNKTLSGHIFLYSIVINFDGFSGSIHDMLTELQDTDTLSLWIKKWQDMGALKPKQAVCDSSRALMNALCLALNFQTVKVYNETCFLYGSRHKEFYYRPQIFTYLRLDVAHLQVQVRRWTCFKLMRFAKVRHFFMHCFSLMIDAQTLEEFKAILSFTCIVGGHENQDTVIKNVLEARKKLEKKIAERDYFVENKEEQWNREEDLYDESVEEKQSNEQSRVKAWINIIYENSLKISHEGSEPNPFYFNDFIVAFIPLAVEFCLWSSVPLPYTRGRATSSYSEGHFSDVKNRVLKNFSGLVRADKFVKIMLDNGSTSATLLHSKLKVFHENEGPCPSPLPKESPQSQKEISHSIKYLRKLSVSHLYLQRQKSQ
uniref:NOF_15 protein n=1 Tax=Fopius arisanus TaxID=64838 RepID=A0A0C9QYG9_9HYME